jgi:hypothetical protein
MLNEEMWVEFEVQDVCWFREETNSRGGLVDNMLVEKSHTTWQMLCLPAKFLNRPSHSALNCFLHIASFALTMLS